MALFDLLTVLATFPKVWQFFQLSFNQIRTLSWTISKWIFRKWGIMFYRSHGGQRGQCTRRFAGLHILAMFQGRTRSRRFHPVKPRSGKFILHLLAGSQLRLHLPGVNAIYWESGNLFTVINSITPKAAAEHDLLFSNQPQRSVCGTTMSVTSTTTKHDRIHGNDCYEFCHT